jgi:NAD+ diphosphatase
VPRPRQASGAPGPAADSLAFAFLEGRMLVREIGELEIPELGWLGPELRPAVGPIPLGDLGQRPCVAVALESEPDPARGLVPVGLRELFARLDEPTTAMVARASQTLEWWLAHAYCGRCGASTDLHEKETARVCPACGAVYFPRISPAVITLVHRGSEVLLAHGRQMRPGFYALVAGFVEPGETLEEAVAREVREEVGVEVTDLRYFGSQAWPFPSQLMVGFTARYAGGEVRVQESEVTDARWFPIDALPGAADRPAAYSIAGRLIASFEAAARSDSASPLGER